MEASSQKNKPSSPLKDSTRAKNLRKESDKMMEDAKRQERAMPRGGESIGGT